MRLQGIYAPIVTPFHADESINYPVLEQLIEYLIQNKISGLVPGGTTGEVYAWSDQERLDIFQFVKDKVNGRVALIAGTNSGATRDVIRYSQAAERMGYDALMVAVPPYSRPSQRELLAHYEAVARAVKIPIVLYNFPWRAGTEVGFDVMDGLTKYDHVVGIKEASSDMSRVYAMRARYGDRYQIVCGSDDQALDYFLWGATAWIGGAASCAPRQHADVLEAALAGDFVSARARMDKLMPLLRSVESGSYLQKVKLGCELLGIPVGAPRLPLLPLADDDRAEFEKIFKSI
ncbi:MAG: 4-hydroxy-tetrahydrodipicolinate synthase [Anaerolineaceae bacterium]|nr:4-hydroxy-tetrahydrodipicolinate synthase [Anaerolineae bacterium]MBL1172028.1 4-hydroxy-tetrahydrodipicolinate synthase [Chloroflexota bacterium]MDL1926918.1 4-hydroxy-tetrahydrodipicolinate synthase [Anaerolineae bacterium AMX1]WKZ54666.1 MAG: 4-hydroxy-tetrahydrodipicolinate synthase [Anaerolineales bacterium]GJQ38540.1 MAG: 4-hydroxy-tetrahydrodipicolinate synthase [Anaerolineaceae bacterium]